MSARVTVVTAGHLALCPRMLKAADALAGAGYQVRVVSARFLAWADAADADVFARRAGAWRWEAVNYQRDARWLQVTSALRLRAARAAARGVGPGRAPLAWAARAVNRVHPELAARAAAEPADLIYGGTAGGLATAAAVAERLGVPLALDLEDFHTAEHADSPEARLTHGLLGAIESAVLPRAAFCTTASAALAAAYGATYGVTPRVLHNTFPLPPRCPPAPPPDPDGTLRLYWFSQTIGPGRGLEDVIHAAGQLSRPLRLTLRGRPIPAYVEHLRQLAQGSAPRLELVVTPPAPPDAMIELAAAHDVGLALERTTPRNRDLTVTNKPFTYLAAGLPLVLSVTTGQRELAATLGAAAQLYEPDGPQTLAQALERWVMDPVALARARAAAWAAAEQRWHWEHPAERGELLAAVAAVLGEPCP